MRRDFEMPSVILPIDALMFWSIFLKLITRLFWRWTGNYFRDVFFKEFIVIQKSLIISSPLFSLLSSSLPVCVLRFFVLLSLFFYFFLWYFLLFSVLPFPPLLSFSLLSSPFLSSSLFFFPLPSCLLLFSYIFSSHFSLIFSFHLFFLISFSLL